MTQNWRYVTNCWDLKWFCTLNVVSFVKMLHGIVPSVLEESEDFLSISVWITTSVSHLWISHIGLGYKSILCCGNYILDLRWHVVIIIIISSSSIKLVEGECAMLLGSLYIRLSYKYTQPVFACPCWLTMKALLSQCCISSDSDTGSVLIVIIITAVEYSHYSSPYILILFGLLKSVSNLWMW